MEVSLFWIVVQPCQQVFTSLDCGRRKRKALRFTSTVREHEIRNVRRVVAHVDQFDPIGKSACLRL